MLKLSCSVKASERSDMHALLGVFLQSVHIVVARGVTKSSLPPLARTASTETVCLKHDEVEEDNMDDDTKRTSSLLCTLLNVRIMYELYE